MVDVVATVRSLGYGGMLGGGVLGLLYSLYPNLFPGGGDLKTVIGVGGILGAGGHQLIDAWIIKFLLLPIGRTLAFYASLAQLQFLRRFMGKKAYADAMKVLIASRVSNPVSQISTTS